MLDSQGLSLYRIERHINKNCLVKRIMTITIRNLKVEYIFIKRSNKLIVYKSKIF
jgi:hypothetical protein